MDRAIDKRRLWVLTARSSGATFIEIGRRLQVSPVRARQIYLLALRGSTTQENVVRLMITNFRSQPKKVQQKWRSDKLLIEALSRTLDAFTGKPNGLRDQVPHWGADSDPQERGALR
jgi:hypothetical protein